MYEEPYLLNLVLEASAGQHSTSLEFYESRENLKELGGRLVEFPKASSDVLVYELGSEAPAGQHEFYLKLKFFVVNPTGKSAIQIRTNNNQEIPHQKSADFCIAVMPAEINRLGRLLLAYCELKHTCLEWSGSDGELTSPELDSKRFFGGSEYSSS